MFICQLNCFQCEPKLLFLSFRGLQKALEEEEEKTSKDEAFIADIKVAISYVEDEYKALFTELNNLLPRKTITFQLLWTIFLPNTLVYTFDHSTEQPRIVLCQSFEYERAQDGSTKATMQCDIIRNDGRAFGVARESLTICKSFKGMRSISDLGAYPLQFHGDPEGTRRKCIDRGQKFVAMNCNKFNYREISGPGIGVDGRKKFNVSGILCVFVAYYFPSSLFNRATAALWWIPRHSARFSPMQRSTYGSTKR